MTRPFFRHVIDRIGYDAFVDLGYADRFRVRGAPQEEARRCVEAYQFDALRTAFSLPANAHTPVLCLRSMPRTDYRVLFDAAIEAAAFAEFETIADFTKRTTHVNLDVFYFFQENAALYDELPIASPHVRMAVATRLLRMMFILHECRSIKPELLFCFADMQPLERLFVLYFRSYGARSVTMQHGLYVDYGDYDTVNRINYLHHCADHFLAWGEVTKDLIVRHRDDARASVCGKPLIFLPDGQPDVDRTAFVSVLLDQAYLDRYNREMVRLVVDHADRHGLDVRVRFHPSLNKQSYLAQFPGITEDLDFRGAELVVGHTTSLLFESLALGQPAVQFRSAAPTIALPDAYRFTDLGELEACAARASTPPPAEPYIACHGEQSLARYRTFFRSEFPTLVA